MVFPLLITLTSAFQDLLKGFMFGTGYGAGVRFGFQDVYPFFQGQAQSVMQFLGLTAPNDPTQMAKSGFKTSSGLMNQPMGLKTLS